MTDELDILLESYHTTTLRQMAEAAGLNINDKRGKKLPKDELHGLLKREFFTRERILNAVAQLDERERAVLDRLLLRDGEAPSRTFQRELLRAELVIEAPQLQQTTRRYYSSNADTYGRGGYGGSPDRRDSIVFEDVVARLTYWGLVFGKDAPLTSGKTAYKLRFHPSQTLFVPRAVRQYLPEPEPLPPALADWQPERVEPSDPALLLRDLYLYWDFARHTPPDFIQSGFIGKRSLKAINDTLLQPDPRLDEARREDHTYRLYLLRLLLQALGLLKQSGSLLQPTTDDPTLIPPFWSQSTAEQVAACLKVCLSFYQLNELNETAAQYGPNYVMARQAVLTALKTIPPNHWIERDELLLQVQDTNMDFLFPAHSRVDSSRSDWYSNYQGVYFYGNRTNLLDAFQKLEAQFVDRFSTNMLHPLGIIDVGYGPENETGYAVRLTPLGHAVLAESPEQLTSPGTGKVVVQPNFHLLAMGPVSLAVLARLDLFADRQQADRGAFEYQITRDSIYQAQQAGLAVDEITDWLTEISEQELPQNVRRSLQEWGAYHERIVFRVGVSLLQAANADLLTRLIDSPESGPNLARQLTPEVALVTKEAGDALISSLVGQDILPVVSDDRPEAADHSVTIQPDGVIKSIHAVPSLHLSGRLARLAEAKGDSCWQLTAASVRRAGGSKNKVQTILDELGKLQRGDLPEALAAQVKAWGGYYGEAAVETLTLIEFRDRQIMAELIQHPDLKGMLSPFPTNDRALAVVSSGKLNHVTKILTHLGVPVKDTLQ